MGLNLSNAQIAEELGLNPNDAQRMTEQLRTGIVERQPEPVLSGEVECDEVYVIAAVPGSRFHGVSGLLEIGRGRARHDLDRDSEKLGKRLDEDVQEPRCMKVGATDAAAQSFALRNP